MTDDRITGGLTDKQLVKTCREFRRGILGKHGSGVGMCAAVCWPLSAYLSAICGVKNECVTSDLSEIQSSNYYGHVWIKLSDGRALDPTFDQFCSEEPVDIYLGKPTEFHGATP